MLSIKRLLIWTIFLECFISQSLRDRTGTITNEYGRISNIDNEHIYVAARSTLTDCVRQCADFSIQHVEYLSEDCFAYNYNMESNACELIHSVEPLDYTISFQTKWMTGFKYESE